MADLRTANRAMFWRILRRLLSANRGRLLVMLLALGAGAAVTAALLNLQVDAKRRLTTEFRAFGANVMVMPHGTNRVEATGNTLDFDEYIRIPEHFQNKRISKAALLYGIADVSSFNSNAGSDISKAAPAVVVGYGFYGDDLSDFFPGTIVGGKLGVMTDHLVECQAGEKLAALLRIQAGRYIHLRNGTHEEICYLTRINRSGGPEDGQLFLYLGPAQNLLDRPNRISAIALSVPGQPAEIQSFVDFLSPQIMEAEVRPIRQFTEGEAKIYSRISGLLTATVGIVLLLTALCVMAAMTNVAMERKMDVGLMKAIGGATRRVLRLFLAEAALLGLAGGLLGAAVGIFLSIGLGKAVFGVAAQPRLIVYPVAVGLTVLVAILSAFPLRRLANLRPASVFRGEA